MFEAILTAILDFGGYLGGLIGAASHHGFVSTAAVGLLGLIALSAIGAGGYLIYRATRVRPAVATLKDKKKSPEEIVTLRRVWGPASAALGGAGLVFAGFVFAVGLGFGLADRPPQPQWAKAVDPLMSDSWSVHVAVTRYGGTALRGLYSDVAPLVGVGQSAQPGFAAGRSAAPALPDGAAAICLGAGCIFGYLILLIYMLKRARAWFQKRTEFWSPLHMASNNILVLYVLALLLSVLFHAVFPEAASGPPASWPNA